MDTEKKWLEACELLEQSTLEMQNKLNNNFENEEEKKLIFRNFFAENSYLYAICKSYEPTDDRTEIVEHKIMYLKTKLILEKWQQKFALD